MDQPDAKRARRRILKRPPDLPVPGVPPPPDGEMADWLGIQTGILRQQEFLTALMQQNQEILARLEALKPPGESAPPMANMVKAVVVVKKPMVNKELRTIGRLQYGAVFKDVWLGGEHYDLRRRNKARLCLQYLVAEQAFDEDSARHLETEINPFVRKKCQLPPLPAAAQSNLRMQHFFNDPARKLRRLGRELVKAAGRNGRFYLQVF